MMKRVDRLLAVSMERKEKVLHIQDGPVGRVYDEEGENLLAVSMK